MPGIGDAVGFGLSGYLVWRASRLGVPRATLARMLGNVALETVIGAVPVLGDAFDFAFKANNRNVRLLERALADRRRELERQDRPGGARAATGTFRP